MSPRFRQLLWHLALADGAQAILMDADESRALLGIGGNRSMMLVDAPDGREGPVLDWLTERLSQLRDGADVVVVVVGGGADVVRPRLEAAVPRNLVSTYVHAMHWGDGELWVQKYARVPKELKKAIAAGPAPGGDLQARIVEVKQRAHAMAHLLDAWGQAIRRRPRRATLALAGGIGALALLTMAWGGFGAPNLVRMGGVVAGAPLSAEPWRWLSSAMLHGGLLHLAMNGMVLMDLGTFLERVLGWSRFLVVTVVSALVGSVLQQAFGSEGAVVIGFSGALLGLMLVSATITLNTPALPPPVSKALRVALGRNLFWILLISLMPGVAFWGHLGGALAGAAIGASGALTRGFPGLRPGEDGPRWHVPETLGWRVAGGASALLLVFCTALSLLVGQPWLG